MSCELYVLAKPSQLPSLPEWQAALNRSSFPIKLDESVNLVKHSGFLPCTFKDLATGFELAIGHSNELTESYPELKPKTYDLDAVATFSWSGDMTECVSAFCSAAVLTQLSNGILYDPQEGQLFSASEAALQASQLLQSLQDSSV